MVCVKPFCLRTWHELGSPENGGSTENGFFLGGEQGVCDLHSLTAMTRNQNCSKKTIDSRDPNYYTALATADKFMTWKRNEHDPVDLHSNRLLFPGMGPRCCEREGSGWGGGAP